MPLGPTELIIILAILLLLFGAKKLPELGKSLGGGMREFKDSVTSKDDKTDTPALSERGDIPPVVPNPPEPQPARVDPPASGDVAAKPTPPPTDGN